MFGLAIASYQKIETPLRKGNWFGKRWKTLVVGGSSLIITALSIALIPKTTAKSLLLSVGEKIYPPSYYIKPGIPQQDFYCHLPQRIENAFQDCLAPQGKNTKNIFLIGDSHASNHHWSISNALKQTKSEFAINTLVEYGLIRYLNGGDGCGNQKICIKNAGNAYKNFFDKHLKAGDYLLISLARDRFTVGEFDGSPRKQNYKKLQFLHNNLLTLSQIVDQKKATLILIGDIPKVCTFDVNYMHEVVRRGMIKKCTVGIQTSIDDRIGLNNVFNDIANKSRSTLFVDPHNELCDEDQCSAINRDRGILYSDNSPHFSKDNKAILTNYWSKIFIKLGI